MTLSRVVIAALVAVVSAASLAAQSKGAWAAGAHAPTVTPTFRARG